MSDEPQEICPEGDCALCDLRRNVQHMKRSGAPDRMIVDMVMAVLNDEIESMRYMIETEVELDEEDRAMLEGAGETRH